MSSCCVGKGNGCRRQRVALVVEILVSTLLLGPNEAGAFLPSSGLSSLGLIRPSAFNLGPTKRRENQALFSVRGGSDANDPFFSNDSIKEKILNARSLIDQNFFLLGMFLAVGVARALPSLGVDGGFLKPDLIIGKFGVVLIFLFSGLSLKVSELTDAVTNVKLNAAIQLTTFGAWPILLGLPLTNVLRHYIPNFLPQPLLDGLLILSCLPTTVNMCILLTSAAGGNVATALCNAVISNLTGVFVTPALLLLFFGTRIQVPFGDMVVKLCNKVLLPVAIGQALRGTKAKKIYIDNSKTFKRLQEMILLGIVWNAFCNAFTTGFGMELKHALTLLTIIPSMHLISLFTSFKLFERPFWNISRGEVVAAMFTGSQKTLAFGLPLVNTVFQGNPSLAAYCAPIMIVHPLQLIIGSFLVPRLKRYTGDALDRPLVFTKRDC